ncbi:MAG TPA: hypothetical protein VEK73_03890 [Xanthobacteraceae bacterium]|nr:hypothetical protein [Xanthobacteraceae bacterium]
MSYISVNNAVFSNAVPIAVMLSVGQYISPHFQVVNDVVPGAILEYTNNIMPLSTENEIILYDLNDARYLLKAPVLATLRQDADDEYVAAFPEAELSTSGGTAREALDWLRSSIVELYELFKGEKHLGPLPARQLRVLEQYIGKKPYR